jgi:hypothetical protein
MDKERNRVYQFEMDRYKELMGKKRLGKSLTNEENDFLNGINNYFQKKNEDQIQEAKEKPININKGGLLKKDKSSKKMMGGGKVKKPYTASNKRYAYGGKVSGRKPKYKG